MKRYLPELMVFGAALWGGALSAAPVSVPAALRGLYSSGHSDVGVFYDRIDERKLAADGARVKADIVMAQLQAGIGRRWDVYMLVGGTDSAQLCTVEDGATVRYELEDTVGFGLGIQAVVCEWEQCGAKLFCDISGRYFNDLEYASLTVDETTYVLDQFGGYARAEYLEFQGALGVAQPLGRTLFYAGGKYSDVRVSSRVNIGGTDYAVERVSGRSRKGLFVGVYWNPVRVLSIGVQARAGEETAVSWEAMIRF